MVGERGVGAGWEVGATRGQGGGEGDGGGEGVAQVVDVGDKVSTVKPGDMVYPEYGVSGTWATHIRGRESEFERVYHSDIDPVAASVLRVNPGTAYRMLRYVLIHKQLRSTF